MGFPWVNVTTITDADYQAWLAKHSPKLAAEKH